jgi:hypothetical protein
MLALMHFTTIPSLFLIGNPFFYRIYIKMVKLASLCHLVNTFSFKQMVGAKNICHG